MEKAKILKEIIESRRSIFPRDYSDEPIDENVLREILESANFAPQHKKTKPWRLKIFKSEDKRRLGEKMADLYKTTTSPQSFLEKKYVDITNKIDNSDAIITICVNFSGLVPEWEEIAATSMAVQNMYLTANVNGIGCYWSSPGLVSNLGEFLELEDNQRCLGLFYLGKIK